MRSRAWDAHAAETVDNVEQSFQDEALAPAPRCRGRDSSDREVLPHVVYVLGCDFYMYYRIWEIYYVCMRIFMCW